MSRAKILEGKWEEILSKSSVELAGRRVRIFVEPEETETDPSGAAPNEHALATLRDLVKLQEGMKETDGSETDRLLREARSGGTYGLRTNE